MNDFDVFDDGVLEEEQGHPIAHPNNETKSSSKTTNQPAKKKAASRPRAKANPNASRICSANEVLVLAPDKEALEAVCSEFENANIEQYEADSEYWFAGIPLDVEDENDMFFSDQFLEIAEALDNRGIAVGLSVDYDHDYEEISFFDGQDIWKGDFCVLIECIEDVEADDWNYCSVGAEERNWSTQKRIFNKVKKKLSNFTLKDMVALFEKEFKH